MDAELLFFLKLNTDMERWGFNINKYGWCVMNKDIKRQQCTILWHVDDIKTSHRDLEVATTIIDLIIFINGREYLLTFTCGKVHEYLQIIIDFYEKGKVKFTMYEYIDNIIQEIHEDTKSVKKSTPSEDHLFTTNKDNPQKLSKEGMNTLTT